MTTGSLIVGSEESLTPARSFTAANYSYSASYMLDSDGLWTIMANQQFASANTSSRNAYTVSGNFSMTGSYTTGTYADINRDGLADVLAEGTSYSYMVQLINNGDGTYTSSTLTNMGLRCGMARWSPLTSRAMVTLTLSSAMLAGLIPAPSCSITTAR